MIRNKFILYAASIVVVSVYFATVLLVQKKPVLTTLSNISSGHQLSQFQLKNICNCYVVMGGMTAQAMYDSTTLQEITTDLFPGTSGNATSYFETTLAPSGKSAVSIKQNSLWYQERPGMLMQKVYTPNTGETIGLPHWSTDEKYIVLAIQVKADQKPTEGLWASALRLIRLSDGQSTTIITREESSKQGMQNLFAVAISNGGKTVWFSSGDMNDEKMYSWSASSKKIALLPTVQYSSIYATTTVIDGQSVYLSIQGNNKLHRFAIDTGADSIVPIDLNGDAPVSGVSPDGQHIVYLIRTAGETYGTPTVYNLSTGASRILTDTPLHTLRGMSGVIWSPDSTYAIYVDDGNTQTNYYALRTNQEHQVAERIANVPAKDELSLLYALLPLPTVHDEQLSDVQNVESVVILFFSRGKISSTNLTPNTTNEATTAQNLQNLDFQFNSQQSAPGHPVFTSARYHFEYSPVGNFGFSIGQPHGTEQFEVGIFTTAEQNKQGIDLHIYRNDVYLGAVNVEAFRAWRKDNGYDDPNDGISTVKINNMNFFKATQTDGINSQSDYYYLVQPNFVYAFIFSKATPTDSVTANLNTFKII